MKTDYDKAFNQAREEALGDPTEQPTFFTNIYFVKKDSLRKSVCLAKKSRHGNQHGGYNTHGGNNKALSSWQEEAIRQYCYKQWEAGNGAAFSMVMSAITHLRAKMNPPLPAPTKRWFVNWLKKNPMLHTIHTKPISYARLDIYTEESVKEWFADLCKIVGEFEIDNGKKILNMDESGARVGYPTGETVIVPIEVKKLYTASPENRKSVTIIETIRGDGKKTLPPYNIAPGKKIMDNWIASELVGDEGIDFSPTR